MRIKVLSDSTCDLSAELVAKHDITLIPLNVIKNGENFKDGVTISPDVIFAHVAAGGDLCSTAAVSIGDYEEVFTKYAAEYDGVVHINIGSGFSASHQNALLAAEEFDNVLVVDSMSLSTGQGMIVLEACRLAREGADLAAIKAALNELVRKVEISFVLDRLEYMVKGGRCSAAAALGANLLNLKPCIEVKEGKLQVVKKYRGSFTKCLQAYVKDRLAGREDIRRDLIFVTHTAVPQDSIVSVCQGIEQNGGFEVVEDTVAGCTVSCHCGPGTLGIIFVRK